MTAGSTNQDELLVPGNSEELLEFIGLASKNCLRQVDISLPKMNLVLPSKHFYEVGLLAVLESNLNS